MASPASITSVLRRLLTPVLLVSPLIVMLLVPAFFYGMSSGRVANEANQAMRTSLVAGDEHVSIRQDFVCPQSNVEQATLKFSSLAVNTQSPRTSLSTVGFDEAVINMKGVSVNAALTTITTTTNVERVTAYLHQDGGEWCLHDLDIAS